MEEEYKEKNIGSRTFRIRLNRSFKAQCDLQRLKRELQPDDIIKADCEILDLERDEKGKVQGKKWFPVTDEIIEDLTSDDGLELFNELLDFRFKKKDNLQKKEQKALKSSSKKSGSGMEDSSSNTRI